MTRTDRPFDLVVFDWDGTLLDSEEQIVASFLAACGDLLATVALPLVVVFVTAGGS